MEACVEKEQKTKQKGTEVRKKEPAFRGDAPEKKKKRLLRKMKLKDNGTPVWAKA